MTNVQKLSADSLHQAAGIESVVGLPKLRSLGIGIWNLEDFGFLLDVTSGIEDLFIGRTKSKKPDLAPLDRLKDLKTVYLEGQSKNIDVLSGLSKLEDVTLRSITVPGLDFLKPLKKMWSLDIKLGGTRNLAAIEAMEHLKYLELWQIKGLSDVGVVSTLTGLQNLFFQSLAQVTTLPDFRSLSKLRRVTLETMKGLKDVSSLRDAPALEEFVYIAANNFQPGDFVPLLENPSVQGVRVGFGSDKKNRVFEEMMAQYGKEQLEFREFVYTD